MSSETPAAATLVATATAYLKVFENLDPGTIESIQTDDYKHEFAPASLNPPAAQTREAFATHLRRLGRILRSFPVTPKQVWPNTALRQVVIWADSVPEFYEPVSDDWKGEYVWVLTMDQSGKKIQHVLEFLDSKATEELRGVMREKFDKIEGDDSSGGWKM